MIKVLRLQEVDYKPGEQPERDEWEIDVIFYDKLTKKEEIVRVPFGVLKDLFESVKEEKR